MNDILMIITTVPTQGQADQLARLLVEQQLAPCAQVSGPVRSVYRWQGQVEQAEEWYCTIKAVARNWEAIEACIREHHPYRVPEIIALPVIEGSAAYVAWVRAAGR